MVNPLKCYLKDPVDAIVYTEDWDQDDWLGTDTITGTPEWIFPEGITKDSQSNTATTASAKFSGGTHGTDYYVACKITTAGGQVGKRSILLRVRNR